LLLSPRLELNRMVRALYGAAPTYGSRAFGKSPKGVTFPHRRERLRFLAATPAVTWRPLAFPHAGFEFAALQSCGYPWLPEAPLRGLHNRRVDGRAGQHREL
jgi:hypothetical protein